MSKLISVYFLVFLISSVRTDCTPKQPEKLPIYVIDLDLDPHLRFQKVSYDYKNAIATMIEKNKKIIQPFIVSTIEMIAKGIVKYLEYPFNEEMKGIANATGLNIADIVIFNLIYEMTAFCTSIVAQQADGKIIHGRNLDYDFAPNFSNLTYLARFQRKNKLIYTSVHTAGYIGVLTAHKKNAFTFSINERDQGHWWTNLLYAIFDKKAQPIVYLSRNVLENAKDFNEALEILSKTEMIAPVYFIIGGVKPNEGAVITRKQDSAIDTWRLNASSKGIESWYLLETNYDHWVQPPANDDRHNPGIKHMNEIRQENINAKTMLNVLNTKPTCNNDTIYTVYMSAVEDDSKIQIIIRY